MTTALDQSFSFCILEEELYISNSNSSRDDVRFQCIDTSTIPKYHPFCGDFGPMQLSSLIRFIELVELKRSRSRLKPLMLIVESGKRPLTNGALLIGGYLIIRLDYHPDEVIELFSDLIVENKFELYRDATYDDVDFGLSLSDCWRALQRCKGLGWIHRPVRPGIWGKIDIDEYENYENPLNGDMTKVVPGKIIAFKSPEVLSHDEEFCDSDGHRRFSPNYYLDIFQHLGVSTVVRLNDAAYDAAALEDRGIRVVDLPWGPDAGEPAAGTVEAFAALVSESPGLVAVHCRGGRARAGTLVAAQLVWALGFPAREAVAWVRMMRPGSVVGRQQHFLCRLEASRGPAHPAASSSPRPPPRARDLHAAPVGPASASSGGGRQLRAVASFSHSFSVRSGSGGGVGGSGGDAEERRLPRSTPRMDKEALAPTAVAVVAKSIAEKGGSSSSGVCKLWRESEPYAVASSANFTSPAAADWRIPTARARCGSDRDAAVHVQAPNDAIDARKGDAADVPARRSAPRAAASPPRIGASSSVAAAAPRRRASIHSLDFHHNQDEHGMAAVHSRPSDHMATCAVTSALGGSGTMVTEERQLCRSAPRTDKESPGAAARTIVRCDAIIRSDEGVGAANNGGGSGGGGGGGGGRLRRGSEVAHSFSAAFSANFASPAAAAASAAAADWFIPPTHNGSIGDYDYGLPSVQGLAPRDAHNTPRGGGSCAHVHHCSPPPRLAAAPPRGRRASMPNLDLADDDGRGTAAARSGPAVLSSSRTAACAAYYASGESGGGDGGDFGSVCGFPDGEHGCRGGGGGGGSTHATASGAGFSAVVRPAVIRSRGLAGDAERTVKEQAAARAAAAAAGRPFARA